MCFEPGKPVPAFGKLGKGERGRAALRTIAPMMCAITLGMSTQALANSKTHATPKLGKTAFSQAYGDLNNFDCVNDTGSECHGFEIELDDIHCTDITYTYDYNHYGVPKISQDLTDPLHPKTFVRYAANYVNGVWSAYTAIPSGPISPTMGHQFTNPSINFGGEHFADFVISDLGGRTVLQSIDDGIDTVEIWRAVHAELRLPASER